MPLCDNLVIWHPIPSGSRLCASASATADDFLAGIRLVGMDGSETQFLNADLDPGPAHRSLTDQGYAARLSITPQLAVGGWAPRPRKLRPASTSRTAPKTIDAWTLNGPRMFGIT